MLLAFLRGDLVERLGWLTDAQLLDAVAIGQVTPGPLFTTATFIGYVLAGVPGALVATVAIFLPAFVFVALIGPIADRLRSRPLTASTARRGERRRNRPDGGRLRSARRLGNPRPVDPDPGTRPPARRSSGDGCRRSCWWRSAGWPGWRPAQPASVLNTPLTLR